MVHFEILKEFQELKGQFVITASHRIERLVAVGEDDIDYYWITFNGREFKWNTCVGRLMPLKGYLRDEDYNELVRLAKLNHYDLISFKDFTVVFENWKNSLSKDHKFHTDFCFDLEKI
ncbi:hypothetical protein N9Z41_00525 [bacterium]|jgi:hypothetical protein|nr:hypothetical protein [bacterium]